MCMHVVLLYLDNLPPSFSISGIFLDEIFGGVWRDLGNSYYGPDGSTVLGVGLRSAIACSLFIY